MNRSVVFLILMSAVVFVGCNKRSNPAGGAETPAVKLPWLTDLPKAEAQAMAEHKMIFLEFTGSDWCPACIEFKEEVASTPEFASYARTNLVLVEVDFPRRKALPEAMQQSNAGLVGKFKIAGATGDFPLPTFILLNGNGGELGRWKGYAPGSDPKQFIQQLDEAWKK